MLMLIDIQYGYVCKCIHIIFLSEGKDFKDTVGKNASAFLNSEGGKLMFGVHDSGRVEGIDFSFKMQDTYRVGIDEVLKKFNPPVMPRNCRVEYLPVLSGEGKKIPNLKVRDGTI